MSMEVFQLPLEAVALAAIVASIFTDGHTRTYLALTAIFNVIIAGHIS